MSLNNFIPTIWSASILKNLHKAQVYAQPQVVNRDYQGDISALGDTVKINAIGPVTVGDYVKDVPLNAPQVLQDSSGILTIEKAKFFNFAVDDIDKAQGKPSVMEAAMSEAAYAMSDVADQYLAGLYTGVAAANIVGLGNDGAPITPTANTAGTTAYEYLVKAGQRLTEANVRADGRWAIVPPWFYALLQLDNRFVSNVAAVGTDVLRNGLVGRVAGFDILVSNNVPNTGAIKYKIICGVPMAISYAEQINTIEAYRVERGFGDGMKGLHLFGAKLVRPQAIAVMTANPS